jgi:hypothetical protein
MFGLTQAVRLTVKSIPRDGQQVCLDRIVTQTLQCDLEILLDRLGWDLEHETDDVEWPVTMTSVRKQMRGEMICYPP